jgi:fucose permease
MGAVATVIGATLPVVVREFSWTYSTAGILLAGNAAGYFCSTLVSGLVLPRFGVGRMLILGLCFQAAGVLFFGADSRWIVNLAILIFVGVGQGMLEIGANCTVIQLETKGQSRLMNIMHSAFTIGAVVAPLLTGLILGQSLHWRLIYLLLAGASALLACGMLWCHFPEIKLKTETRSRLHAFRDRFLICCTAGILLYVGIEMGVSSWIGEYYVVVIGGGIVSASFLVSVFWGGILLGRLGMGLCYLGQQHSRVLLLFSGLTLLGFVGLLLAQSSSHVFASVFLTGIGLSVLYPVIMVLVGERFSKDHGLSVGIVASGGGIGAFCFPLVMGWLADTADLRVGFSFFAFMSFIMLGVVIAIVKSIAMNPSTTD